MESGDDVSKADDITPLPEDGVPAPVASTSTPQHRSIDQKFQSTSSGVHCEQEGGVLPVEFPAKLRYTAYLDKKKQTFLYARRFVVASVAIPQRKQRFHRSRRGREIYRQLISEKECERAGVVDAPTCTYKYTKTVPFISGPKE